MILMQLSEDLFFGLPTLEYSRDRANMIQAYKIMNNIDNDKIDKKMFTMADYIGTRCHWIKKYSMIILG